MKIASYIDHTLLDPAATAEQLERLCAEAVQYGFASVCVSPYYVPRCVRNLEGSDVKVCTVIGFPLGSETVEAKAFAALQAVKSGAEELDMMINLSAIKSGNWRMVEQEIQALAAVAEDAAILKVILETCRLTDQEKVRACQAAVRAGAHFVKTSTGFSTGGATLADVELLRRTVGPDFGVKASGGIRTYSAAMDMLKAGANRIGTSAGVAIVHQEQDALGE